MSSPPPGWPNPHADAGVEDTLALLPPDALWPPLPPPDLSRPPPWLLPPPSEGTPPPPPPPGGWTASWETAVPWPPPPAPPGAQDAAYGHAHAGWPQPDGGAGAYDGGGDEEAYDEEAYDDEEEYDADADGAAFAAGEVVWRVGDALDDDDDDDDGEEEAPEIALELTEEWAARFAQTEHRRAQRKLQERAANRQGPPSEAQPSSRMPHAGDAVAGPPLTVVDIVHAAGTGASRPNEELYGAEGAAHIAALEAAVQARYAKALESGGKAHLWPCEPLRNA